MITSIYSLGKVVGGEILLAGWAVCAGLYLLACFLVKGNRKGWKRVLLWFLAAEVLVDIAWAVIYYDAGSYVNHGVGGTAGALLWPLTLLVFGGLVTGWNLERNEGK